MGETTRGALPVLGGVASPAAERAGAGQGSPGAGGAEGAGVASTGVEATGVGVAGTVVRPETASLWAALREVMDPEFPISLVDLGLIYDIRRDGARVEVDLTFTATACPCMDFIQDDTRERLLREPGVEEVVINVVWDPPWTTERISEEGRATLRGVGVAA